MSIETLVPKTKGTVVETENHKVVQNHKVAAKHHAEASKNHLDAAKSLEAGEHEKAAHSTVLAHGHSSLAHKAQKEDVKHHIVQKETAE
jgi:hypothetical protein